MKLALGTAQFGLDYGVSNAMGKVVPEEVTRILEQARKHGVGILDTANAYGDSEAALGKAGVEGFEVVTKLPPIPADIKHPPQWVEECVFESMRSLDVDHVSAVLLHRPMQLLEKNGEEAWAALSELKRQGFIDKTGISIYGPAEIEALSGKYTFDMVQAPFNVLDRRLESSGWLRRLKQQGTEVHARSLFLQGLLLMSPDERPAYFRRWAGLFDHYNRWLEEKQVSALEGCLGFAAGYPQIDCVVVGVASSEQLEEVVTALSTGPLYAPAELDSADEALVNPALWGI